MSKYVKWTSKAAKFSIILSLLLVLLVIFMIGQFLFKIYILDYRFDDGELHPPIEENFQKSS